MVKFTVPDEFLHRLKNERLPVYVCLKWGQKYIGFLNSFDSRINIELGEVYEFNETSEDSATFEDDQKLEKLIIRCNNILTISDINSINPEKNDLIRQWRACQ
ncbi:hypothetical protein PCE1_000429 [Barthelona sp. PCE]